MHHVLNNLVEARSSSSEDFDDVTVPETDESMQFPVVSSSDAGVGSRKRNKETPLEREIRIRNTLHPTATSTSSCETGGECDETNDVDDDSGAIIGHPGKSGIFFLKNYNFQTDSLEFWI